MSSSHAERVLNCIDQSELIKLAINLIDIPSPEGHERQIAEFVVNWLSSRGFDAFLQKISDQRGNAVGILRGTGGGYSLMYNGHMDTSFTGTAQDLSFDRSTDVPELKPKGFVKDDKVCGLGIANMKAGLAAFLMAGAAIKKAGVSLKGDLILTGVGGELCRVPIGDYLGGEYEGSGSGTRYLVNHGIQADYAINCDGSNLGLSTLQAGAVFMKITTFGRMVYTPFTRRAPSRNESYNALLKMMPVIDTIEEWAAEYELKNTYKGEYGTVVPKVNIGCIEAGAPWRPSYTPGVCNIYVDIRLPPKLTPVAVKEGIQSLLRSKQLSAIVEVYRSQRGYEAKGAELLIDSIKGSYRRIFSKELPPAPSDFSSLWSDNNVLNEAGIPSVKIGPAPPILDRPQAHGEMPIQSLVDAAKLYALTTLHICNTERR